MRNGRFAVLSLALLGVGAFCRKAPPSVEPLKPIRLAIVVKTAGKAGACSTETFPKRQRAREGDDLVWSIIDATPKCKVSLKFADEGVVKLGDSDSNSIKGTVTTKKKNLYKYSVLVNGNTTEGPEIEIGS